MLRKMPGQVQSVVTVSIVAMFLLPAESSIFEKFYSADHPLSLSDKLNRIRLLLSSYNDKIEFKDQYMLLSQEIEEDTPFIMPEKSSPRLISKRKGFFDELKKNPSVKTVLFRHDIDAMRPLLIQRFFHFTSNNCSMVEAFTHLSTCVDDLHSATFTGHPLDPSTINEGLPDGYQHEPHNETWTYLYIIQNGVVTDKGFSEISLLFLIDVIWTGKVL
jgi:hypothetical protein